MKNISLTRPQELPFQEAERRLHDTKRGLQFAIWGYQSFEVNYSWLVDKLLRRLLKERLR